MNDLTPTDEVDINNADNVETLNSDVAVIVLLDDEVEVIQTMQQGPPGPPGPAGPASIVPGPPGATGPAGPRGNSVLYGSSDPLNAVGINGDFYINMTSNFMFGPKVSGVWPPGVSLIGPKGPKGDVGPQGPIGLQGPIGPKGADGTNGNTVLYGGADPTSQGVNGDFYINTFTNFIFGPKANGAWPGGVSLVGPKGDTGPQGQQGVQGPQGVKGDTGPQGAAGTATLLISDTPPQGAADGALWFESDTGLVYANYNDGTSTQWVIITPQPDLTQFVQKIGDVMTGDLQINKVAPALFLNKTGSPQSAAIFGQLGGLNRFTLELGNGNAESTGNAGSNCSILRYTDAGVFIDTPFAITRSNGTVSMPNNVVVGTLDCQAQATIRGSIYGSGGNLILKPGASGGPNPVVWLQDGAGNRSNFYFETTTGTTTITDIYSGASIQLLVGGGISINPKAGQPVSINGKLVGASGGYDVTGNSVVRGALTTTGACNAASMALTGGGITITAAGANVAGWALYDSGATLRSQFYFNPANNQVVWTNTNTGNNIVMSGDVAIAPRSGNNLILSPGSGFQTAGGPWNALSDARIKTVESDYERGLEAVLALHPVIYRYKGNDSFKEDELSMQAWAVDKSFVGFVAQEVEPVMPEMVKLMDGFIDGEAVHDLRSLDTGPLIYALVNSIKTLNARIAALEALNA